jgi:hypothetical protein
MKNLKPKNLFNVEAVDTDELRKSIARDLELPDRPLTIDELARLRAVENSETMQPVIDWSFQYQPDPADLRREEERLIDEIDEELNENT